MNEQTIIVEGIKNTIRTPKEPDSKVLEDLYDVCNRLFKDKPQCFYKHEEVEAIRKSRDKIFI